MDKVIKKPHFAGIVTEVYDKAVLVSVSEGEDARRSSDLIRVSLNVKLKDSMTHLTGSMCSAISPLETITVRASLRILLPFTMNLMVQKWMIKKFRAAICAD